MYEEAQEIFDYLPIEAGSENLYISVTFLGDDFYNHNATLAILELLKI